MAILPRSVRDRLTRWKWLLIQRMVNVILYFQRSRFLSPSTQPNAVKHQPCRPQLYPNRIFTPTPFPAGRDKLPLVIQAHGGGFIGNNPARDDPLCRLIADTCQCIAVGIDYSKAPTHRFPVAYEDVVALTTSLIDDPTLPVDKSKVVLCGNSAGGNLVLAAVQDERLRSRVHGVLGLYAVCDAATLAKEKALTRPDPNIADLLESSYDSILDIYIGPNPVDREDPRLSPARFRTRENLPPNVFLIGAEHDLLCGEAERMAEKLAKGVPRQNTDLGWEAGGVVWARVPGQLHGFDQFGTRASDEKDRLDKKDVTYRAMCDWLTGIFDGK
ncbi:Arylacetamide deacetylase-like 2 [Vermiconidia calcicola]|uniref:Arylacetamide deacetylase-like 2 n=1 Tax=Vermiconidia calcicola TaxID=1690605 RepID=A0ACC3M9F8_9PEZI|nr:Arylacetamide deacetylase-like 2 [Vermiconidia calcicola]